MPWIYAESGGVEGGVIGLAGIDMVIKLAQAFPGGFLNGRGEFVAHKKANEYFLLADCETETDVKCKVLEWLSRGHTRQHLSTENLITPLSIYLC